MPQVECPERTNRLLLDFFAEADANDAALARAGGTRQLAAAPEAAEGDARAA